MTVAVTVENLSIRSGSQVLLQDFSIQLDDRTITTIIGPSGSGKTTFLRSLNRLSEHSDGLTVSGQRTLFGKDLLEIDPNVLRQNVGMVFQKPCVFPGSIHKNVIFGIRHLGLCKRREEGDIVERELKRVGLFEEVKDRLHSNAFKLSVGQQQRLCLARAMALEPKVLLLDEPTSALDPVSVQKIESLVGVLKERCAVVLVTHSLVQARRLADKVVFLARGRKVQCGSPEEIFVEDCCAEIQEFITANSAV
jgi:phosphate transport system ATP-binding protein